MASRASTLRPKRKGASGPSLADGNGSQAGAPLSAGMSWHEYEAYLQALSENNPLAIVILDQKGRVQMCNLAFEELFGYRMTEIVGADLDSLLSPPGKAKEAL